MEQRKDTGSLDREIEKIAKVAKDFGLDFYNTYFEICPADILHTVGAYGMPVRFSHWSFGKNFFRMKSQYDYNLNRIYELVINTDPCYAFLLESNSMIQNKTVVAHVFAHSDFFKNNIYFRNTSKRMLDTMAVHAEQINYWQNQYGPREVEIMLDAILSLQEHLNPHSLLKKAEGTVPDNQDLLLCLAENGQYLADWQRDLIKLVRQEMLYFWPQMQTKIINEGWATYWHTQIMHTLALSSAEAIEFAKLNASIIMPIAPKLNPYFVGYKLLCSVAEKYGLEELFKIRERENDLSFLRNYLTTDLLAELDLYIYHKVGHEWVVLSTEPEQVKDELLKSLVNCGIPTIVVESIDYVGKGELYLKHQYEGLELDIPFLERTLPRIYLLWGLSVHLETVVDDRVIVFSYDGKKSSRKGS